MNSGTTHKPNMNLMTLEDNSDLRIIFTSQCILFTHVSLHCLILLTIKSIKIKQPGKSHTVSRASGTPHQTGKTIVMVCSQILVTTQPAHQQCCSPTPSKCVSNDKYENIFRMIGSCKFKTLLFYFGVSCV